MAALVQWLPPLLFGVFAGALSDRLDRRLLVVTVDVIRSAVLMLLALSVVADVVSIGLVLGALFLLATAEVFADNTSQTLLPMLVPRDDLAVANARLQTGFITVNQLAGPPLGSLGADHSVNDVEIGPLLNLPVVRCGLPLTFKSNRLGDGGRIHHALDGAHQRLRIAPRDENEAVGREVMSEGSEVTRHSRNSHRGILEQLRAERELEVRLSQGRHDPDIGRGKQARKVVDEDAPVKRHPVARPGLSDCGLDARSPRAIAVHIEPPTKTRPEPCEATDGDV